MEQRKSLMRNQEGFTLIEIIAVLVLLGILAAVAVPRYFDMQATAQENAIKGAIAAYESDLAMQYAKHIVTGTGTFTPSPAIDADWVLGDFTAKLTGDLSGGYTITLTASTNTQLNAFIVDTNNAEKIKRLVKLSL
jgi:prepilin-type N-terminal cleavage/methylation domain-containing protein